MKKNSKSQKRMTPAEERFYALKAERDRLDAASARLDSALPNKNAMLIRSTFAQTQSILADAVKKALVNPVGEILNPK